MNKNFLNWSSQLTVFLLHFFVQNLSSVRFDYFILSDLTETGNSILQGPEEWNSRRYFYTYAAFYADFFLHVFLSPASQNDIYMIF